MISALDFLILFAAALAAGLFNALAGGGSIFTFPALVAIGVPPIVANVTNTVALCPGYVGGVLAQRRDSPDRDGGCCSCCRSQWRAASSARCC